MAYGSAPNERQNLSDDLIKALLGETSDKKRNIFKQSICSYFFVALLAIRNCTEPHVATFDSRAPIIASGFYRRSAISNHVPPLSVAARHNMIKYGAFVRGARRGCAVRGPAPALLRLGPAPARHCPSLFRPRPAHMARVGTIVGSKIRSREDWERFYYPAS